VRKNANGNNFMGCQISKGFRQVAIEVLIELIGYDCRVRAPGSCGRLSMSMIMTPRLHMYGESIYLNPGSFHKS
jgi:hypothetical protein